jgi:hypothetical protein
MTLEKERGRLTASFPQGRSGPDSNTPVSQAPDKQEIARLALAREKCHKVFGFATLTLEPRSKDPDPTFSPHAYESATTDWATAEKPYVADIAANFAVHPGVTGHAGVDTDNITSLEDLDKWNEAHGVPVTLTVKTGKGFHEYFLCPGGTKTHSYNIDGKVGEVRSNGAYLVGPGSRHPNGEIYEIVRDIPMAPLPEFYKKDTANAPALKPVVISSLIPEGNRNAWLTKLAGYVHNFEGGALPEETMYEILKSAAVTLCVDGESYVSSNDEKLKDLARRSAEWSVPESMAPYVPKARSYTDLMSTPSVEAVRIIADLIYRRTVNIAVGDSNLGKTPYFYQLALCVASGIVFIGQETTRNKVLYVDFENTDEDITEYIRVLSYALGVEPPTEEWFKFLTASDLDDPKGPEKRLEREIEAFHPALVIVDSLRGYNPMAETKSEVAAKVIGDCQRIAKAHDTSWVFIHHPRKKNRDQKVAERPDLFNNDVPVVEWLEETAGHRVLINQTYTRFAFARPKKEGDLGIRGVVKGKFEFGPWFLARDYNDAGEPVKYRRVYGSDLLSKEDRGLLENLPYKPLGFSEMCEVLFPGNSSKKTYVNRFKQRAIDAGVLKVEGKDHTVSKTYTRVNEKVGK